MVERCGECDELWREYAKATAEHVQLIKQQEQEALSGGYSEDIRSLEALIELANKRRDFARDAIKKHLATDRASGATA